MTSSMVPFRRLDLSQWPEADRLAWEKALAPADPFDPSVGQALRWRPASRATVVFAYGMWLGWLEYADQLVPDSLPGDRVTAELLEEYRVAMKEAGLADYTVSGRIKGVGDAISALTPDGDWRWIQCAAARLQAQARPTKDVREIMQRPEALLQLGDELMEAAENDRFRTPCDRATLFRDGLMISFLTLCPLRRANLRGLRLGHELQNLDGWRLRLEADTTKGSVDIECWWPPELVAPLERYLAVHRDTLMQGAPLGYHGSALWISRQGKPMSAAAIAVQVRHRTADEFGKPINPHAFRHIAATAVASGSPLGSTIIRDLLGHKSLAASEKYYIRAGSLSASALVQARIKELRAEASAGMSVQR